MFSKEQTESAYHKLYEFYRCYWVLSMNLQDVLQCGISNVIMRTGLSFQYPCKGLQTKTTKDTKIYFDMPRTSVNPMFKDLKKHNRALSLGEVKLRKYE